MPFFKTIETIEDHNKYKTELKTALKAAAGKKFLYFNKHKLTPKRDHLLVIDPPQDVVKTLGTPKALGKCELNEKEEIVLAPSVGKMRVRPVRAYVQTFWKDREIFVPKDEPEGDETELLAQQTTPGNGPTQTLTTPLVGTSPGKLDPNTKLPPRPTTPTPTTPPTASCSIRVARSTSRKARSTTRKWKTHTAR